MTLDNMDGFKNKNDPTIMKIETYIWRKTKKHKSTQTTQVYEQLMVKTKWFKEERKIAPRKQACMDLKMRTMKNNTQTQQKSNKIGRAKMHSSCKTKGSWYQMVASSLS